MLRAFTKRNVTELSKINKSSALQVMDRIKQDLLFFLSFKEPKKKNVTYWRQSVAFRLNVAKSGIANNVRHTIFNIAVTCRLEVKAVSCVSDSVTALK